MTLPFIYPSHSEGALLPVFVLVPIPIISDDGPSKSTSRASESKYAWLV